MKKYIFILLALLPTLLWAQGDSLPGTRPAAAPAASPWDRANTAYINTDYREAIAIYDSILLTGQESQRLYYNLGNACFKDQQTGRAILYYNKALRMAPTDADTRYNLAVANSYVKDKIEQVPTFFVERWIAAAAVALSGNTWTWVSIALLVLALSGVVMYLLPGRMGRRKAGFWAGVSCAVLFIGATLFAVHARSESLHPTEGIVMSSAVAVKSSPDRASTDLFVIHEGTKVRVVGNLQGWIEVTLADGKKGWIEATAIEMI
ncbi:MAG: tetratricopeptide repeat protein [Rikenellaceae bacterium]|nr:tetratricopeptide repeat protein [Rikenellaceae bacterium]